MRKTVSVQPDPDGLKTIVHLAVKNEYYRKDWDYGGDRHGTSVLQLMSIDRHICPPLEGVRKRSWILSYYKFIYPDRVFTEYLTYGDIEFTPTFGLRRISLEEAERLTGKTHADFLGFARIRDSYHHAFDRSPWIEQEF